ncbi:MAG: hypothetical protein IJ170_05715 [Ruminococcus sp.]|nr:hypothetical protein [Ruminococcus sp.]
MGGFFFILLCIVLPIVINAAKNSEGGKQSPAQKRQRDLERLKAEVSARKAQEDQRQKQEEERRRIDAERRRKEEENRRAREAKKQMEALRAARQEIPKVKETAPVKAEPKIKETAPVKAEPKIKETAPVKAEPPVKASDPIKELDPVRAEIPEIEPVAQGRAARDQLNTERVFTARRYLMDITKLPSKAAVDKAMEEDKIILAALSFDGMSTFMCPLGYAADCDELLGKMGRLSSEANSFFKISFNKKRAQWYFDCPSSYRVIPYDDRRRETYFSDGLVVIRDLLGALGYSPEITVPEECKKGFELPEIK